jgi:hypothetical protein
MAPPRLPTATKKLRGTYEAHRDAPRDVGRYRLTEAVPPPPGVGKDMQREWMLHMSMCLASGVIATTDLRSFTALVEAAVLSNRAYREAAAAGPIVESERGCKTSPQWSAWVAASGVYRGWCREFGLTPGAAQHVAQASLPKTGRPTLVA